MSVVQASSQLLRLVSRFLCCLASGFADRCGVLEGPCLVVVSFLGFLAGLEVIGCDIHSCVRVFLHACVYILHTLPLPLLFFVHVLHFLQFLTGIQNRLHSFNQSDWWFDLSV